MKNFHIYFYKNIFLISTIIFFIFSYLFFSIFFALPPDFLSMILYLLFIIYYVIKKLFWDIFLYNGFSIIISVILAFSPLFSLLIHYICSFFYHFGMFLMIYYEYIYTFIRESSIYIKDLRDHQYAFLWGEFLIDKIEIFYPLWVEIFSSFCLFITWIFVYFFKFILYGSLFILYWSLHITLGNLWWFQLWYYIPLINLPIWIAWKSVNIIIEWSIDEWNRAPSFFIFLIAFVLPSTIFYLYEEYIMYRIVRYMDWRLYMRYDPDSIEVKDIHREYRRYYRFAMVTIYSLYKILTAFWKTKIKYSLYFAIINFLFIFGFVFYIFSRLFQFYALFIKNILYNRVSILFCKVCYWYIYYFLYFPPNHPYNFFFRDLKKIKQKIMKYFKIFF